MFLVSISALVLVADTGAVFATRAAGGFAGLFVALLVLAINIGVAVGVIKYATGIDEQCDFPVGVTVATGILVPLTGTIGYFVALRALLHP